MPSALELESRLRAELGRAGVHSLPSKAEMELRERRAARYVDSIDRHRGQKTASVTVPCAYLGKEDRRDIGGKRRRDSTLFHFDECGLSVGRSRHKVWRKLCEARERRCEKFRIVLEFDVKSHRTNAGDHNGEEECSD